MAWTLVLIGIGVKVNGTAEMGAGDRKGSWRFAVALRCQIDAGNGFGWIFIPSVATRSNNLESPRLLAARQRPQGGDANHLTTYPTFFSEWTGDDQKSGNERENGDKSPDSGGQYAFNQPPPLLTATGRFFARGLRIVAVHKFGVKARFSE